MFLAAAAAVAMCSLNRSFLLLSSYHLMMTEWQYYLTLLPLKLPLLSFFFTLFLLPPSTNVACDEHPSTFFANCWFNDETHCKWWIVFSFSLSLARAKNITTDHSSVYLRILYYIDLHLLETVQHITWYWTVNSSTEYIMKDKLMNAPFTGNHIFRFNFRRQTSSHISPVYFYFDFDFSL